MLSTNGISYIKLLLRTNTYLHSTIKRGNAFKVYYFAPKNN